MRNVIAALAAVGVLAGCGAQAATPMSAEDLYYARLKGAVEEAGGTWNEQVKAMAPALAETVCSLGDTIAETDNPEHKQIVAFEFFMREARQGLPKAFSGPAFRVVIDYGVPWKCPEHAAFMQKAELN